MKYVHFFQYNIPADNQYCGRTDRYVNVMAQWDNGFYNDGKPIVYVDPINLTFGEAISVKDWAKAHKQIEELATQHFAEIARIEKINQARAVIAVEENPILERYQTN